MASKDLELTLKLLDLISMGTSDGASTGTGNFKRDNKGYL